MFPIQNKFPRYSLLSLSSVSSLNGFIMVKIFLHLLIYCKTLTSILFTVIHFKFTKTLLQINSVNYYLYLTTSRGMLPWTKRIILLDFISIWNVSSFNFSEMILFLIFTSCTDITHVSVKMLCYFYIYIELTLLKIICSFKSLLITYITRFIYIL